MNITPPPGRDSRLLTDQINRASKQRPVRPLKLPIYTVATVPAAGDWEGCTIYVSDESGGAVMAFSDGTNWRRVTDRAVIT